MKKAKLNNVIFIPSFIQLKNLFAIILCVFVIGCTDDSKQISEKKLEHENMIADAIEYDKKFLT